MLADLDKLKDEAEKLNSPSINNSVKYIGVHLNNIRGDLPKLDEQRAEDVTTYRFLDLPTDHPLYYAVFFDEHYAWKSMMLVNRLKGLAR